MSTPTIDGELFAQMLSSGAAALNAHTYELNSLNVFPVSDGDTGTNMMRTMESGLSEIHREPLPLSVSEASQRFANGALLGARGNSGVILSQIFAGINEGLSGLTSADLTQIAAAYKRGIETAYAAVQEPTEGTILTVFRESTEYAAAKQEECAGMEDFFRFHLDEARRSLAATKDLLPVLKEADVVDSGAAGYLYLAEGMYDALCGKQVEAIRPVDEPKETIHIERFTRDTVLEYGYCTEFLLRLTTAKTDIESFDMQQVRDQLTAMGGESIVAYQQGDIVKVHVHTFTPGKILDRMQAYGEFLTVKVENMMLGHTEENKPKEKSIKPYAVVAAVSGDGLARVFKELGADQVLITDSPSTKDFLDACEKCEAKEILVLPNHKNSFLAAQQAAKLLPDKNIRVIETKNVVQGYSALSVLTPGITDMDALEESAKRAAASVIDGEVTVAIRDAEMSGLIVHEGDYLAKSGGVIAAVAKTPEEAVLKLLQDNDMDLCELLTLFTGKNVSEDRCEALVMQLQELYPECEITVREGGQEVFDYYLALE